MRLFRLAVENGDAVVVDWCNGIKLIENRKWEKSSDSIKNKVDKNGAPLLFGSNAFHIQMDKTVKNLQIQKPD